MPDAIELVETIILDVNDSSKLMPINDYEIDALNLLVFIAKKTFLLHLGWKEVPGDNGATEWLAPVTFTKPLYFALEAAYALEADGEGIVAYATQELTGELLKSNDMAFMESQEADYIAETGHSHGNHPNY
jgi:hypothetical protein